MFSDIFCLHRYKIFLQVNYRVAMHDDLKRHVIGYEVEMKLMHSVTVPSDENTSNCNYIKEHFGLKSCLI